MEVEYYNPTVLRKKAIVKYLEEPALSESDKSTLTLFAKLFVNKILGNEKSDWLHTDLN